MQTKLTPSPFLDCILGSTGAPLKKIDDKLKISISLKHEEQKAGLFKEKNHRLQTEVQVRPRRMGCALWNKHYHDVHPLKDMQCPQQQTATSGMMWPSLDKKEEGKSPPLQRSA